MIIEKLLLHVLIVLSPIIIFLVLYEGKPEKRNSRVLMIFMSISAMLCVLFPFNDYGVLWDLRFVPILIAFIYGSRTAGLIVSLITLIVRIYVGGDMVLYGIIGLVVNPLFFYFVVRFVKENKYKNNRLKLIMVSMSFPVLLQLVLVISKTIVDGILNTEILELIYSYVIYFVLFMLSVIVASLLYEMLLKRERMQEELIYAVKQQSISELSASIAHEVRNPLTVVKGFLQLMKEDQANVKSEYYHLILSELNRAENIIHEYLNLAKPQLGESSVIPVKECVSHIITLLNPYACREGVVLKDPEIEQEVYIETNRSKFKQALINFIKNAIEAASPDGSVEVSIHSKNRMVEILISDTGKGMNKEQLDKIGTVYYSTKEKGTGLGTMVSIRLIEKMNGSVVYTSKPDVGTTVRIMLPEGYDAS
ncbi:ATP-binding protein [Alkalicoccobacillus murimartini]|uniref:histidine kinase n=1 Tax=Alkalicoccobacillus murimartini TaxID=171685 RepID=A0ABT9YL35_9BACI|nr:sensor histidine kinase [Alkalicoccobacillus murimartini]MDQ0208359.1 two-component system sporulation sensor kinase B [Alkalicoccobacillus murimartini]